MKPRKVAQYGVLTALALMAGYVETLIPLPVPVPGIKLGIANSVTIVCFYLYGRKCAWTVSLLRIFLSALLFGNVYSLAFSLSGGVLSLIAMTLAYRTGLFSVTGVSMLGGVTHNIGQIAAAAVILKAALIMGYIPVLTAGGIVSGMIIGLISYMLIRRIKNGVYDHE